jgi:hypothetical protein
VISPQRQPLERNEPDDPVDGTGKVDAIDHDSATEVAWGEGDARITGVPAP